MFVILKGAGDLASGVAVRLHRCGFDVTMTEIAHPTAIRRTVSFSRAVTLGEASVEGVHCRLAKDEEQALAIMREGDIALLVDEHADCVARMHPDAVVDAILAKRNMGTAITDAPRVIGLGPGFTAGEDCHAVVETMRGHHLGRVLLSGAAQPNTGVPGLIAGYGEERILRAPCDGVWQTALEIGMHVDKGAVIATVGSQSVYSRLKGVLRGLLPNGTPVKAGMKSGDVDPRDIADYCETVSDKARAIGGGVLEALLMRNGGGTDGCR